MADFDLDATKPVRDGVELENTIDTGASHTLADDYFVSNDGKLYLYIENADSTNTLVVTVTTTKQVDGLDVTDREISVATTATEIAGPFPVDIYNNADGKMKIEFSGGPAIGDITLIPIQV